MSELFLLFLLAVPGETAKGMPAADTVLRSMLAPTAAPYEAELELRSAGRAPAKLRETAGSGGRTRRELLGPDGKPALVAVFDGKHEWVHDLRKQRLWKSGADWNPGLSADAESAVIAENYELRLEPGRPMLGRKVWLLELVSRASGELRRQLWIDRENGLLLRSKLLRAGGGLASETAVKKLALGARIDEKLLAFTPAKGQVPSERLAAEPSELELTRKESGLEPSLPTWLPGGFVFDDIESVPYGRKKMLHARFSDGLDAVSLFQLPPRSRPNFGKAAVETLKLGDGKGQLAWLPEGHALSWTRDGRRFLLVGPLGAETLKRIAESVR